MIMDLEPQSISTQQFVSPEMRPETSNATSNQLACDLGSLISFSCRTRAENFARTLQMKLKTLGSFDNGTEDSSIEGTNNDRATAWKSYSLDSHFNSAASNNRNRHHTTSPIPTPIKEPLITTTNVNGESNNNSNSESKGQNLNGPSATHANADSDMFYDFDLASPGSPVENGIEANCYTVINPCDDLYCEDCSLPANKAKSCSKGHSSKSHGTEFTESGCIFSSPASTSPDHQNSDKTSYQIQHSVSGDDCTSDASDSSIYYDVESSSPAVPSTPKLESEPQEINQNYTAKVELHIISSSPKPSALDLSALEISLPSIEPPFSSINDEKWLSPDFAAKVPEDKGLNKDDDDDSDSSDNDSRPRLQRCSSLKTGKTPPGTPGRKKMVRFADVLGLDLADVRTFMDEIPKIPKSAYRDLEYPSDSFGSPANATLSSTTFGFRGPSTIPPTTTSSSSTAQCSKLLVPTFHQPVSRPDFFDRIRDQKVLMENAYLSDNYTIKGTVRVLNMDFYKSVYVRYTLDEWKTFEDFQATYVEGSCDGFSDKFEFSIKINPDKLEMGTRVIIALRFHCKGEQFWDSNYGQNYLFHCVPGSSPNQQILHAFNPHTTNSHHPYSHSPPEDPWISHMWL